MKHLLRTLAGLALLLAVTVPAAAEVKPSAGVICYGIAPDGTVTSCKVDAAGNATSAAPAVTTTTDKHGTITSGGTGQTAIAANTSRLGWCISNPSTATESLRVRVGAAATSSTGIELVPGASACNGGVRDTELVSVFAATTSHAFDGWEKQ